MVRLNKVPGEFNISDVRDSFMRQFMGPGLNLVLDTQDTNDDIFPYLKSTSMKLVEGHLQGVKSGGMVEKKTSLAAVIR